MESKVFENIAKTPKSILPDGFQYRMMKTYFVDADTKESKLGMKQALVQNDRVHEYASELRVISETELRLASSGFWILRSKRRGFISVSKSK